MIAAALAAAFFVGWPPGAQAACLTPERVERNVRQIVGDSLEVDEYGAQGVKAVIAPAYRAVYEDELRPADGALVFGSTIGRGWLAAEVLVVLFQEGCVVGWAPIPRQIYQRITAGRAL